MWRATELTNGKSMDKRRRLAHGLECRQFGIAEIPTIKLHVLDLALQSLENSSGEIHFLELLRAPQATWAEYVDFHQFVADDVQADKEHPVFDQPWAYHFGKPQHRVVQLSATQPPARMDIAADVVASSDASERRILALVS